MLSLLAPWRICTNIYLSICTIVSWLVFSAAKVKQKAQWRRLCHRLNFIKQKIGSYYLSGTVQLVQFDCLTDNIMYLGLPTSDKRGYVDKVINGYLLECGWYAQLWKTAPIKALTMLVIICKALMNIKSEAVYKALYINYCLYSHSCSTVLARFKVDDDKQPFVEHCRVYVFRSSMQN